MRMVYIQQRSKPVTLATRLLIVSLLAMTMVGISPVSPALGNTPATGSVTITGTAFLPVFPASPATGTFNGRASGVLRGHSAVTLQWELTSKFALITGSFLYSEPGSAGDPSCLVAGDASGVLLIIGDSLSILTPSFHYSPETGQSPITYFKAEVLFFWKRVGASAVVTTNITLDALVGGLVNLTKTLIAKLPGTGFNNVAVAAFNAHFPGTPGCDPAQGLVTADIVAEDLIAKVV